MKSIPLMVLVALLQSGGGSTTFAAITEKPAAGSVAETKAPSENASRKSVPTAITVPAKATAAAGKVADQTLESLFGRRSDDLEIKRATGGSTVLDLRGRFSTVSIIVRNPDGTIGHFCVDNIDAARHLLASPLRPPAAPAAAPAPLQ
jgi:hypothetical protein